jgi:type IV pilus assembly protein PilV
VQLTRNRQFTPSRRHAARGFSLIELLVAVLVMGIGVLGVTALQMVSLQNNRMALERGEAVQLAYDMMDRIRANPSDGYDGIAVGNGPPNPPDCIGDGANCSEAQMITFDEAAWKCLLGEYRDDGVCANLRANGVIPDQEGLPDGDGSVVVQENLLPNGMRVWDATVTVQWTGADNQIQTVVIDSQA